MVLTLVGCGSSEARRQSLVWRRRRADGGISAGGHHWEPVPQGQLVGAVRRVAERDGRITRWLGPDRDP